MRNDVVEIQYEFAGVRQARHLPLSFDAGKS
jgi:hypothetical protein